MPLFRCSVALCLGILPPTVRGHVRSTEIEHWISQPRFEPFLERARGDRAEALALYAWHVDLAAACFTAVQHFEVLIRNSVDRALTPLDSGPNVASSWLLSPSVLPSSRVAQVERVAQRNLRHGIRVTKDRLISSLPFSFWVHIFGRSPKCEALWREALHEEFPGVARRKDVVVRLESLRKFRNRLAHHDSLLSLNVRARHDTMLEVAGWISPEARRWLEGESRVGEVLAGRPGLEEGASAAPRPR